MNYHGWGHLEKHITILACCNDTFISHSCSIIFSFTLVQADKIQGPGSIRHYGGKCIHVLGAAYLRPKNGEYIVLYQGCGEEQQEFQLWPNGSLMLTRHRMCVKPIASESDVYSVKVRTQSLSFVA